MTNSDAIAEYLREHPEQRANVRHDAQYSGGLMKAKGNVFRKNISLPRGLKRRMDAHPEVNWSKVAAVAFEAAVDDAAEAEQETQETMEESRARAACLDDLRRSSNKKHREAYRLICELSAYFCEKEFA